MAGRIIQSISIARCFAFHCVSLMKPIVTSSDGRILSTRQNSRSSSSVSGLRSRFKITTENSSTSYFSNQASSSSAKLSIKIWPIGSLMSCLQVNFPSPINFETIVQMMTFNPLSPLLQPPLMTPSMNGTTFFISSSSQMQRMEYSMILSVIFVNLFSTNSGANLMNCGKSWCWWIRLQASWLYIRERWQKQKQACEMIQLSLFSTFPRILTSSGKKSLKESWGLAFSTSITIVLNTFTM